VERLSALSLEVFFRSSVVQRRLESFFRFFLFFPTLLVDDCVRARLSGTSFFFLLLNSLTVRHAPFSLVLLLTRLGCCFLFATFVVANFPPFAGISYSPMNSLPLTSPVRYFVFPFWTLFVTFPFFPLQCFVQWFVILWRPCFNHSPPCCIMPPTLTGLDLCPLFFLLRSTYFFWRPFSFSFFPPGAALLFGCLLSLRRLRLFFKQCPPLFFLVEGFTLAIDSFFWLCVHLHFFTTPQLVPLLLNSFLLVSDVHHSADHASSFLLFLFLPAYLFFQFSSVPKCFVCPSSFLSFLPF